MKYYYQPENRIITSDELGRKYGTEAPIGALGVFELSEQPSYEPVGFNLLADGTYYPVQSYEGMQEKAVQALMDTGLTRQEAEAALR